MKEEIELTHVLGRHHEVPSSTWNRFASWVQANLRLGRAMTITIDQDGRAVCESREPEWK